MTVYLKILTRRTCRTELHELFVENQQLSDQLKRIQTQTAFLFQCIQSVQQEQEQAPLTEDSPEY